MLERPYSLPAANSSPLPVKASFMATISMLDNVGRVNVLARKRISAPVILGMSALHSLRDVLVGDTGGAKAVVIHGNTYLLRWDARRQRRHSAHAVFF